MKKRLPLIILVVLIGVVAYLYSNQTKSTIKKEDGDFAVEDTAAITKIFLADTKGKQVLLERKSPSEWIVNGKYKARKDAIENILVAAKEVRIKRPVNKSAFENIVKQLMTNSVKVEIYQDDEKPVKTYYVGNPDQDHLGTYMLMSNSSVPFVTHIEGFRGFLTARFFTTESEWRRKDIFEYGYGEIAEIKVTQPENEKESFTIKAITDDLFQLEDYQHNKIENYDTLKLLQYISNYKKIHFESYDEVNPKSYRDSLFSVMEPLEIYEVKDKLGRTKKVKTYLKPMKEGAVDYDGNPLKYDADRMFATVNDTQHVVVQYFVFDNLNKKISDFIK